MWVDPDPSAEPDTTAAAVKRNSTVPAGGIDQIGLEFGGDGTGVRLVFDEIHLATTFNGLTVTGVPTEHAIPMQFALAQNYPNPFNPTTQIEYTVARGGFVTLKVYNILGQEVRTLFAGVQAAGVHKVMFDGKGLVSGVYFYRLNSSNNGSLTRKMVMLK